MITKATALAFLLLITPVLADPPTNAVAPIATSTAMLMKSEFMVPVVTNHPYQYYKGKKCIICGATKDLQVHHIIGQKTLKILGINELVNDPRNLTTLCPWCHRIYAHSGDFHVENGQFAVMLYNITNKPSASWLTYIGVK